MTERLRAPVARPSTTPEEFLREIDGPQLDANPRTPCAIIRTSNGWVPLHRNPQERS